MKKKTKSDTVINIGSKLAVLNSKRDSCLFYYVENETW